MFNPPYPHLFSPVTLAGITFRNRIFASPTGSSNLDSRHFPIAETNAYYERKAMGGAASVCVGDCVVAEDGRNNNGHIYVYDDETYISLAALAESITRHGAVAAIELTHAGSHSTKSASLGAQLYGPSGYTNSDGKRVLPMSEDQIEHVIRQFAEAAKTVVRAGFNMITLHGGHGWLLTEFMSPVTNHRTDKWGGSAENRCRLAVEVAKAVRNAVGPRIAIEMRISGDECYAGGYDLSTGVEIACQLDGVVDLIHVSAGNHEVQEVFTVTHPDMFHSDGANVRFAAEIKKHVKTSLVSTVGALSDPSLMEDIIASGKADIVEIARGLIADPDLPRKASSGRDAEINHCLRCLACFSNLIATGQFVCAINPVIGHEVDNKHEIPAAQRKRVLVAGGGIAGMRAAVTAAARGHDVILAEKSDRLGGVLRCEDAVPFKKKLAMFLQRQEEAVLAAGVSVRLNTKATPELAQELAPDVIIAAIGARPVKPPINGIDYAVSAESVYYDASLAGRSAIILGGGLVGCELAIYLARMDRNVTLVEMLETLNDGGNMLHGLAIAVELKRLGVDIHLGTRAIDISKNSVVCEKSGEKLTFTADTIIYAAGQRPLTEEAEMLRFEAPEYYRIGDCLNPKNIVEATRAGYNIARDI